MCVCVRERESERERECACVRSECLAVLGDEEVTQPQRAEHLNHPVQRRRLHDLIREPD